MKQTNSSPDSRYIFAVLDAQGNRKPQLARSFIQERVINFSDTIVECDGMFYPLYVEPKLLDAFELREDIKCIVSFQHFADKECIAIAREWKPRRNSKPKQQHTGQRAY